MTKRASRRGGSVSDCANVLAHQGSTIRLRRSRICFVVVVVGAGVLAAGCGGTTTDVAHRSSDGGPNATGGNGGGAAGAGNTPGSGGGGRTGSGGAGAGGLVGNGGAAGNAGTAAGGSAGDGGARVPAIHRALPTPCDDSRPYFDAGAPRNDAALGPPVECHTHADCTSGDNGRCVGNGHDGWRCTYDDCFSDTDCPMPSPGQRAVCACANGFRSDNNVCLSGGNCVTDADCGENYCSPTLGPCGRYGTLTGYYCHSAADECIDDADCGAGGSNDAYCAFSDLKGHFACSTMFCVG